MVLETKNISQGIAEGESTFILYALCFIIYVFNDAPHPPRARGREQFLLELPL
jgi:hypothetical protein